MITKSEIKPNPYGYVYIIVNEINGKSYVGQTVDIDRRMNQHHYRANSGARGHLYEAIRKYGVDRFSYYILEEAYSKEELDELEVYYIELYDTFNGYGYNKAVGGNGFVKGEKHPFYGKTHTDEVRKRIGDAHRGKVLSLESKKKISRYAKANNKGEGNPNAKLKERDVLEIIKLINSKKYTQQEIADMFGVGQLAISRIKCGKAWSHLNHLVDN